MPDQSKKSETFARDATLVKELGGRTEINSKFIYKKRQSAETVGM